MHSRCLARRATCCHTSLAGLQSCRLFSNPRLLSHNDKHSPGASLRSRLRSEGNFEPRETPTLPAYEGEYSLYRKLARAVAKALCCCMNTEARPWRSECNCRCNGLIITVPEDLAMYVLCINGRQCSYFQSYPTTDMLIGTSGCNPVVRLRDQAITSASSPEICGDWTSTGNRRKT